MKEKSDKPSAAKKAAKTTTKAASKDAAPVAKKAAAKEPKAPATAKAAKPVAAKKVTSAKKSAPTPAAPSRSSVATAAYLNWCQRRNQGLPDDAMADWIAAESEMGLVN